MVSSSIALTLIIVKLVMAKNVAFYRQMMARILVILLYGFAFILIPSTKMVSFFHRDHPAYVEAYMKYAENPEDPELMKLLDEEAQKMAGE